MGNSALATAAPPSRDVLVDGRVGLAAAAGDEGAIATGGAIVVGGATTCGAGCADGNCKPGATAVAGSGAGNDDTAGPDSGEVMGGEGAMPPAVWMRRALAIG